MGNISESLLSKIASKHYLVSSSGAIFGHPHERTIELLLAEHSGRGKPRLHFNYRSESTEKWGDPEDQKRGYVAHHPRGTSLQV